MVARVCAGLFTKVGSRRKTLSNTGPWYTATRSSRWWPSCGRCPTSALRFPTMNAR